MADRPTRSLTCTVLLPMCPGLLRGGVVNHLVQVPDGLTTALAIDCSFHRLATLALYLNNGDLTIDNYWVKNGIRQFALGRQNSLFAGSLRVGKRVAAVMSSLTYSA